MERCLYIFPADYLDIPPIVQTDAFASLVDLRYLGQAIGFNDSAVSAFKRRKDVYVLPRPLPSMHSSPAMHSSTTMASSAFAPLTLVKRDLPTIPSLVSIILQTKGTGA